MFGKQLYDELIKRGHSFSTENPDVHLAFIQSSKKVVPMVVRLDGIYYNTDQDWKSLNSPIFRTYVDSDHIIFQSDFSRDLVTSFFGEKNHTIINNGTNFDEISKIDPFDDPLLKNFDKVWSCASTWRPHKRLSENIRYFEENSGKDDCLIIAGDGYNEKVSDERIFYVGNLSRNDLISLYKRSDTFIHLGFHDNCPNVVVDARASGCKIICAGSGGTRTIAGPEAIVVEEDPWDFKPMKLYNPPRLDFDRSIVNRIESNIDISFVAHRYEKVLQEIL